MVSSMKAGMTKIRIGQKVYQSQQSTRIYLI